MPGSTRLHSSPLTCGYALNERCYDALGTAATATELHPAVPISYRRCGFSSDGPNPRHPTRCGLNARTDERTYVFTAAIESPLSDAEPGNLPPPLDRTA